MANELAPALWGPPTAYVTRQERYLRGGGNYVPNPDFALQKDPEFWIKLDGNATIRGASDYRRHLAAAPELKLTAPSPRDAPLIPVARALAAGTKGLQGSVFGLADAFRRGLTIGRMFGDWDEVDLLGDDVVRRWYVVRRIEIHDKDRWQLQRIVEGREVRYRWAVWDYDLNGPTQGGWRYPEDEDWYIFHRYQDSAEQLHGRDLARALYYEAYAMHILSEASLDTAERFGAPWIYAKVNREAGGFQDGSGAQRSWASIARELGNVVKTARANNYLIADSRLEMQLLEAGLNGASMIERLIDQRKQDLRVLLLGSNLPTSASSGGSFALAQVQDETTRRLVAFDRRLLAETLTDQWMARLIEWNRPTLATIPTNDGTGRTLADCAAPRVELTDEEVLSIADREAKLRMAQAGKLRVMRADLHRLVGLDQPPADARPEDVIDFGAAAPAPSLGGFAEPAHSPVWQRFAEGRLS